MKVRMIGNIRVKNTVADAVALEPPVGPSRWRRLMWMKRLRSSSSRRP